MASRSSHGGSADPVVLVWQGEAPTGAAAPDLPVQDVVFCPLCRAWTATACETIQDMRGCRSLDETEATPVALQLA